MSGEKRHKNIQHSEIYNEYNIGGQTVYFVQWKS